MDPRIDYSQSIRANLDPIRKICQGLSTKDLRNYVLSSKVNRATCQPILDQRYQRYRTLISGYPNGTIFLYDDVLDGLLNEKTRPLNRFNANHGNNSSILEAYEDEDEIPEDILAQAYSNSYYTIHASKDGLQFIDNKSKQVALELLKGDSQNEIKYLEELFKPTIYLIVIDGIGYLYKVAYNYKFFTVNEIFGYLHITEGLNFVGLDPDYIAGDINHAAETLFRLIIDGFDPSDLDRYKDEVKEYLHGRPYLYESDIFYMMGKFPDVIIYNLWMAHIYQEIGLRTAKLLPFKILIPERNIHENIMHYATLLNWRYPDVNAINGTFQELSQDFDSYFYIILRTSTRMEDTSASLSNLVEYLRQWS